MNNPTHTCGQCKYRDKETSSCHRNPPQASILMVPVRTLQGDGLTAQNFTTWPAVDADHWCGEFSPAISLHS